MNSVLIILNVIASGTATSIVSPSSLPYRKLTFPDVTEKSKPTKIDHPFERPAIVAVGKNEFLPPPPPPPAESHEEPLPRPPLFVKRPELAIDRNEISIDDYDGQQQNRPAEYYDILYNDVINCPLKGYVAEDKILVGSAYRVLTVHDRIECMTLCFHDSQCRSVNVMPHEFGRLACELNERDASSSQQPQLVDRLGSAFYDRIECDQPTETTTTRMTVTKEQIETTARWPEYSLKSSLIEKFNRIRDYEVDSAYRASKDLAFKLNRLAMLEKVLKIFSGSTSNS